MGKYNSFAQAPKKVRDRYIKIKVSRYGFAFGRMYMRIFLTIKERNRNKAISKTIETYRKEIIRAKKHGNECVLTLMNMALFYLLAEKDIQTVKIDALTHPNIWKRKLSLRVILLTIYEWDMGKVTDKNLKSMLIAASVPNELQEELFSALRVLRKAQKKAANALHDNRNAIIAHRDSDALMQLQTIEGLSVKKVFEISAEFYESSKQFMSAFPKVLERAGSIEGLLSYMLKSKSA